mmetsp:Transcript_27378/g.63898  ORF Transcript_27378/g.63898 Transcript_27378/m.63898 type:complete len:612 (-) Transcript_27378:242-2077(-)
MGRFHDQNILSPELERISREMASYLRYNCGKDADQEGWVSADRILEMLKLRRVEANIYQVDEVARMSYTKDKPRFEMRGGPGSDRGLEVRALNMEWYNEKMRRRREERFGADFGRSAGGRGFRPGGRSSFGASSSGAYERAPPNKAQDHTTFDYNGWWSRRKSDGSEPRHCWIQGSNVKWAESFRSYDSSGSWFEIRQEAVYLHMNGSKHQGYYDVAARVIRWSDGDVWCQSSQDSQPQGSASSSSSTKAANAASSHQANASASCGAPAAAGENSFGDAPLPPQPSSEWASWQQWQPGSSSSGPQEESRRQNNNFTGVPDQPGKESTWEPSSSQGSSYKPSAAGERLFTGPSQAQESTWSPQQPAQGPGHSAAHMATSPPQSSPAPAPSQPSQSTAKQPYVPIKAPPMSKAIPSTPPRQHGATTAKVGSPLFAMEALTFEQDSVIYERSRPSPQTLQSRAEMETPPRVNTVTKGSTTPEVRSCSKDTVFHHLPDQDVAEEEVVTAEAPAQSSSSSSRGAFCATSQTSGEQQKAQWANGRAKMEWDPQAEGYDQTYLPLKKGMQVTVREGFEEGWAFGETPGGRKGWFPPDYVTLDDQPVHINGNQDSWYSS